MLALKRTRRDRRFRIAAHSYRGVDRNRRRFAISPIIWRARHLLRIRPAPRPNDFGRDFMSRRRYRRAASQHFGMGGGAGFALRRRCYVGRRNARQLIATRHKHFAGQKAVDSRHECAKSAFAARCDFFNANISPVAAIRLTPSPHFRCSSREFLKARRHAPTRATHTQFSPTTHHIWPYQVMGRRGISILICFLLPCDADGRSNRNDHHCFFGFVV